MRASSSRSPRCRRKGFTPIGASLQGAVKDLGTAKQKTVVLVSDGGDNCAPPQPCGVAKQISKGGIDLKIQAVGFQVKAGARRQLQCIAEAGGGRYVDADSAQELGGQLRALTARALRPYVTEGKRLEATPEPATAKLYGAGQYTTEVSVNSPAWYSFKVGAGQTLSVSATLPDSDAGIPTLFKVGDPEREPGVRRLRRRVELGRRADRDLRDRRRGGRPARPAQRPPLRQARGRSRRGPERARIPSS